MLFAPSTVYNTMAIIPPWILFGMRSCITTFLESLLCVN
jgi:hypothetical protein